MTSINGFSNRSCFDRKLLEMIFVIISCDWRACSGVDVVDIMSMIYNHSFCIRWWVMLWCLYNTPASNRYEFPNTNSAGNQWVYDTLVAFWCVNYSRVGHEIVQLRITSLWIRWVNVEVIYGWVWINGCSAAISWQHGHWFMKAVTSLRMSALDHASSKVYCGAIFGVRQLCHKVTILGDGSLHRKNVRR